MRYALVALAVVLAGCAELPYDPDPGFGDNSGTRPILLHGTFTNDRTQEDLDDWCDVAQRYGNTCALMESYPEQYRLRFSTFEECTQARNEIAAIPHTRPGSCAESSPPTADPDAPDSSEPNVPESWSLRGVFLPDHTKQDLDDWCEVAAEVRQTCALMTSEPPQFSWLLASYEECNDARFRLQRVGNLDATSCVEMTPADATYDVRTWQLTWSDGDERTSTMEWDVVRAWREGPLVTINLTTRGIEGGDFRARLWFTPRDHDIDARLYHSPGGRAPGTFDFLYNESIFWSGDPIDRIVRVDPRSYVTLGVLDDPSHTLHGEFLLDFYAVCAGGSDCPEPDAEKRRVLDGSFS